MSETFIYTNCSIKCTNFLILNVQKKDIFLYDHLHGFCLFWCWYTALLPLAHQGKVEVGPGTLLKKCQQQPFISQKLCFFIFHRHFDLLPFSQIFICILSMFISWQCNTQIQSSLWRDMVCLYVSIFFSSFFICLFTQKMYLSGIRNCFYLFASDKASDMLDIHLAKLWNTCIIKQI